MANGDNGKDKSLESCNWDAAYSTRGAVKYITGAGIDSIADTLIGWMEEEKLNCTLAA